jgi:hypothetical protein
MRWGQGEGSANLFKGIEATLAMGEAPTEVVRCNDNRDCSPIYPQVQSSGDEGLGDCNVGFIGLNE